MRSDLSPYTAVAASAVLLWLCASIRWPWVALIWVMLVPWFAGLDRATSLRQALGLGLLMSVGFVLAVLGWFADAMSSYAGVSPAVGMAVLVPMAPVLQPQFVAVALARYVVRSRMAFWYTALTCASVHVGAEWALPKLFADTIGHSVYPYAWLRQAADIAGAHGLTFVVVFVNLCVWETVVRLREGRTAARAFAPCACALALLASLAGYGAVRTWQFSHLAETTGVFEAPLRVALVQADLAHYDRMREELGTYETVRVVLDTHFALSREAITRSDGLDLLIWPETVYPTTFGRPKSEDGAAFDHEIEAFAAQTGVPLVFGSYDVEAGNEFNAAVFLRPAARSPASFQTYRKTLLFPLTERVPTLLESDVLRSWLPWLGTWKPGSGANVVSIALARGRTVRVAPLICFDAVDPSLALQAADRGAELIVTLSNDSWFADGGGPWQHLVVSAFRSIETRRPQVRATNTGISAVITPTGELTATASVHERKVLVAAVRPVTNASTLMLAWGDWFAPSACVLGLVLVAGAQMRSPPSAPQVSTRGPGARRVSDRVMRS